MLVVHLLLQVEGFTIQGKVIATYLSQVAASVAAFSVKRYDLQNHPKSMSRDVRIVADFAGVERLFTGFCQ
ncbi:hypothetical protein C5167_015234 [Papaver somniferum]|uniref:Uncharacterized protein n=1 Tax=Papaver somniferum TaxID=3469 RepID=A0A4Y7J8X2_PAPSO|nr:hypothetical protein C5167_015234 [Papaver somniferum]